MPSFAIRPSYSAKAKKAQKKAPVKLGRETFLLSHIKVPAQGGKAGSGEPLKCNVANPLGNFKYLKCDYSLSGITVCNRVPWVTVCAVVF
jgi:hypothetical protein